MKIKLQGTFEGEEAEYDQSIHVELTDGFYVKTDSHHVTSLNGRYYRKNSPLIVKLSRKYYGSKEVFILKTDSAELSDKEFVYKEDSQQLGIVKGNAEDFIVEDGVFYYNVKALRLYKKDRIHIVEYNSTVSNAEFMSGHVFLDSSTLVNKEQVITLSEKYPEELRYSLKSNKESLVEIDGSMFRESDCEFSFDLEGNKYKIIFVPFCGYQVDPRPNPYKEMNSYRNMIAAFLTEDGVFRQLLGVTKCLKSFINFKPDKKKVDSDFNVEYVSCKFGVQVVQSELAPMNAIYDEILSSKENKEGILWVSQVKDWFGPFGSERDPEIYIRGLEQDTGGDYVFFKPKKEKFEPSESLVTTGDIGYTFGVELETSFGRVPFSLVEEMNISAVGDRSIGSLEYVTKPLHGDTGMKYMEDLAHTISRFCKIDERCGVHVHVGGMRGTDCPEFSRKFSILAIMLGVQLEKEMFSFLPANRMSRVNNHGIAYCGSIKEYKGITLDNGIPLLSQYVFGQTGGFQPGGPDETTELNRWVSSRYKWLNLVNCNTSNSGRRGGGGFKTIEFRQYNGTLNGWDLKAYVLMSLAFTKYIHTNEDDIVKGKTKLADVLSILNEPSRSFMESWIAERYFKIKKVKEQYSKTTIASISL